MKILFWGMGNTAKEHICKIRMLSDQIEIIAFTDSHYKYGGDDSLWEGFRVVSPQDIPRLGVDHICILSIYEWEIRKMIYHEQLFELFKIISIDELYMMSSLKIDMNSCYKKISQSVHRQLFYSVDEWESYEYLKRNYAYVLCDKNYQNVGSNKKVFLKRQEWPVWVLWLQGFKQAPKVVKVCVHSLIRGMGESAHVFLLDENNLFDYIDLPDYIVQKWRKGIISNTHFSDLVRIRLLNVYGGVWVDSTVYFTGDKLPAYIEHSKLFMFSRWVNWRSGLEAKIAANWLIAAQPANEMLIGLEALLNEYWKKENKLINYCVFHIFWTMVAECFPSEWNQVEKILRDPSMLLNRELTCKYNSARFERLKDMTDFHKLTYKNNSYVKAEKDSFWAKLCRIEGFDY